MNPPLEQGLFSIIPAYQPVHGNSTRWGYSIVFHPDPGNHKPDKKNYLVGDAEESDTEVVLCEELTAHAETPDLFFILAGGVSACAEELGGLVFFKGMSLVVRAYPAVLPADLPVLFGILYNIFWGINHDE